MTKSLFNVGVCETPADLGADTPGWARFSQAVSWRSTDLFLLSELPFGPWISSGARFEAAAWDESMRLHEAGLRCLGDLGADWVAGTRPLVQDDRRVNHGFLWNEAAGLADIHAKQHFPNEEGYFEPAWFQPGTTRFQIAQAGPLRVGFMICTEVWFNEHARAYGRAGAHLILVPRVVGTETLSRWLGAMRMAAMVSGCYVLSSNRGGVDAKDQVYGGTGWIINPNGDVVAKTSAADPLAFHEIDLDLVREAQKSYPCYVNELPW